MFTRVGARAVQLQHYSLRTQPQYLELDWRNKFVEVPRLLAVGVDGADELVLFSPPPYLGRSLGCFQDANEPDIDLSRRSRRSGPAERMPRSPLSSECGSCAVRGETRGKASPGKIMNILVVCDKNTQLFRSDASRSLGRESCRLSRLPNRRQNRSGASSGCRKGTA